MGVIDIITLLDAFFEDTQHFFSTAESIQHNLASLMALISPVLLLCGSFLAYDFYINCYHIPQYAETDVLDQPAKGAVADFSTFESVDESGWGIGDPFWDSRIEK